MLLHDEFVCVYCDAIYSSLRGSAVRGPDGQVVCPECHKLLENYLEAEHALMGMLNKCMEGT